MKGGRIVLCAMLLLTGMLFASPVLAGDLNPPGAPAPTIKTLDQVTPTWSVKLPCDSTSNCPRFVVLADFNSAAVLDKETGLVWEKSPVSTTGAWDSAAWACIQKTVGARKGWRVPTIEELLSLVDPQVGSAPPLSAGHPFTSVQSAYYWPATTIPSATGSAWIVGLSFGSLAATTKTNTNHLGCVGGGYGHDGQ